MALATAAGPEPRQRYILTFCEVVDLTPDINNSQVNSTFINKQHLAVGGISGKMAGEQSQFEGLLQNLLSTDNKIRVEAEVS